MKSARAIPVSPVSVWKPSISALWKTELDRLATLFESTLINPTPLALFNSLYAFVCAPGNVLGGCFDRRANTVVIDSPDDSVNAALRRILKGQERKALKSLCSNGVAAINPTTVAAVQKLHPGRVGELKLPEKRVEQLCVDEKDIADKLFGEAGDRNSSKDVYGWASWLFFPWRGETGGFFTSLVRFVRLLINRSDLFPPICAVLLGTGSLTPLHKLNKDEQQQFADSGMEPKLRPVNSGSLLAKAVLSTVLQTPMAKRAFERIGAHQLSLGVPRGIERLIHTCRAAYDGWLLGRNDYHSFTSGNVGGACRHFSRGGFRSEFVVWC